MKLFFEFPFHLNEEGVIVPEGKDWHIYVRTLVINGHKLHMENVEIENGYISFEIEQEAYRQAMSFNSKGEPIIYTVEADIKRIDDYSVELLDIHTGEPFGMINPDGETGKIGKSNVAFLEMGTNQEGRLFLTYKELDDNNRLANIMYGKPIIYPL